MAQDSLDIFQKMGTPPDSTLSYYDRFADDFEKIPFGEVLPELLSKYTGHQEQTEISILDIGSGPGALASLLDQRGYSITCLDPSREMVARCNEKGLTAIQSTLREFKTDQRFSIIFALSSLIHIPKKNYREHIGKIHQLLQPSGLFFISMLLGEGEELEDPLEKGINRYFSYYKESELEKIFSEESFSILESQTIDVKKMNKRFAIYVLKNHEG